MIINNSDMEKTSFSRREFVKIVTLAAPALVIPASIFSTSQSPVLDPTKYILADFHVHPRKDKPERLLKLLSGKLTGLAYKQSFSRKSKNALLYDEVISLPGVSELEKGVLAKVEYAGRVGYVIKTQELISDNHILGVGIDKYINEPHNSFRAVKEIKRQSGLTWYPHPYIVPKEKGVDKGMTNASLTDKSKIVELANASDVVEVLNAMAINIPFLFQYKRANDLASRLALSNGKPAVCASDAHLCNSSLYIVGNYIPLDNNGSLTIDHIFSSLIHNNFVQSKIDYVNLFQAFKNRF